MKIFSNLKNFVIKSFSLTNLEDYLDKLQLGYKDKVIILLGETGVGKSTFINSITQKSECKTSNKSNSCTQEVKFVKLFESGYNFYFIDTPGLNDSNGDLNHISLLEKISKKGILTTIILVHNYNKVRLSDSDVKILKTFMKVFPSVNFWEHVLFVQSFFFQEFTKDSLIESIQSNQSIIEFMEEHQIIIPNEIKTYCINLAEKYVKNKNIFEDILNKIENMHPFYKRYKEEDEFKIFESKDNNNISYLNYKYIKHIEIIDFEDQKITKDELIDSGKFPSKSTKPEQIIIEREPTDVYRNNIWFCCEPECQVYYWEIKLYNFNGNIYKISSFKEKNWESKNDSNKAEKHRIKMEKEVNKIYGLKN